MPTSPDGRPWSRVRVLACACAAGLLWVIGLAAAAATQDAVVPVSGTVGGAPELVAFSGNVHIRSTLVRDPDFGKPATVRLAIDLVDVVGRGLSSGAKYVSTAEFVNSTELHSQGVIELTFPFHPSSPKGHLVARAGLMALTLKFDARDGAIVGASCRVSGIE
jgi:hypothetical protein